MRNETVPRRCQCDVVSTADVAAPQYGQAAGNANLLSAWMRVSGCWGGGEGTKRRHSRCFTDVQDGRWRSGWMRAKYKDDEKAWRTERRDKSEERQRVARCVLARRPGLGLSHDRVAIKLSLVRLYVSIKIFLKTRLAHVTRPPGSECGLYRQGGGVRDAVANDGRCEAENGDEGCE